MLSLKTRGARGLLRNLHPPPPPQRCLSSSTPARTRNISSPESSLKGMWEARASLAERRGGSGRGAKKSSAALMTPEQFRSELQSDRRGDEGSFSRSNKGSSSRSSEGSFSRGNEGSSPRSIKGSSPRSIKGSSSRGNEGSSSRSNKGSSSKSSEGSFSRGNEGSFSRGNGGSSSRGNEGSFSRSSGDSSSRSTKGSSSSHRRHKPELPMAKLRNSQNLIPKLSPEHADKINTAEKIFRARSLYFTAPKRPQNPPVPPERGPELAAEVGGTISASAARSVAYEHARVFFTRPKAKFLYSAANFRQHPVNTTTPEVCVIGASNCGKSSFVNGLTGLSGKGMAMEGHEAGKTVTMNAYGIGSLARIPRREIASPPAAGEKGSVHGAILVDTPGYGHASRKEWGREIVEYLKRRTMLRGVVLLLSAEKRVSAQDEEVMRLIVEAGRPAMVVFTKMDKTLQRGKRSEEGGIEMRLREVERAFAMTRWDGWRPRIHLTAAKMDRPKGLGSDTGHPTAAAVPGMAGVRIEILEMIGLREFVAPLDRATMRDLGEVEPDFWQVEEAEGEQTTVGEKGAEKVEKEEVSEEKREKPGKAMESDPTAWKGEILSYEELEKKFGDWSS